MHSVDVLALELLLLEFSVAFVVLVEWRFLVALAVALPRFSVVLPVQLSVAVARLLRLFLSNHLCEKTFLDALIYDFEFVGETNFTPPGHVREREEAERTSLISRTMKEPVASDEPVEGDDV